MISGVETARFAGDRIALLHDELDPEARKAMGEWMTRHGKRAAGRLSLLTPGASRPAEHDPHRQLVASVLRVRGGELGGHLANLGEVTRGVTL